MDKDNINLEFYFPLTYTTYLFYDRYRQYGLWNRYTDLYPNHDLVYTVGVDKYQKDWFFAHVPR